MIDEAILTVSQLTDFYERNKPDLIIYDSATYAGRIFGHKWDIPMIKLMPGFAHYDNFLVRQNGVHKNLLPMVEFGKKLDEFLRNNRINEQSNLWHKEPQNIHFIPKIFQHNSEKFDEKFSFVGPCIEDVSFYGDWNRAVLDERPIILISLGISNNNFPEFFKMCIRAFAESRWNIVISLANQIEELALGPIPDNFYIKNFNPQFEILKHASLFICHASMNSILESLYNAVPLLLIPETAEHQVISERMLELGLGEVLQRKEITVDALRDAAERIVTDKDMKVRIKNLQELIHESGGAKKAADRIEEYFRKSRASITDLEVCS